MKEFIIGESYRYSEIPEENTEEFEVSEYGEDYIGQNAIHVRIHESETDIWFIYDGYTNEGILKCVYNN